ncbi:geranylgeranylglyceryl/heptaprenylglyceryl phosphate synthase [archaeon]|nr:MAG: geranylgeranylglyceryl/heptaprenylglyceryl phosphate synthase [archaeon]RLG65671.1 MAG: geranylgeranylglyceryl/heptaprenylglyceryl phosphate synthase [archaeon]HDM24203.1 geranylgeranylglyceryl/heptaprenylglyceryl phosphate synthase [Candidatus Bathyarchaeota archaeon]
MGKVLNYLIEKLRDDGALHFSLIDPVDVVESSIEKIATAIEDSGSDAIMVGGSTLSMQKWLDTLILGLKKCTTLPVILFPGNPAMLSPHADAVWFMSLLNSANPFFISEAQALAAPLVKKLGIEPIPLAYIVLRSSSSVGFVGHVRDFPEHKPELVAMYALAAQYMGFKFVYLEAGSGAEKPVSTEMIRKVKKFLEIPLIVGGGIKSPKVAYEIVKAGADCIVTGTILEEKLSILPSIVKAIKKAGREKK